MHGRQRRRSTIELLFASRVNLGFHISLQGIRSIRNERTLGILYSHNLSTAVEAPRSLFHKTLICQLRFSQRCSLVQKIVNANTEPTGHAAVGKSANQRFSFSWFIVSDLLVRCQLSADQVMLASSARMIRKILPRDIRRSECRKVQISY